MFVSVFITHCYELDGLNDLIGGPYKSGPCYVSHHQAAIGHMKVFIQSHLHSRDFLLPLLTTLKKLASEQSTLYLRTSGGDKV
jgi:hypothetical protein